MWLHAVVPRGVDFDICCFSQLFTASIHQPDTSTFANCDCLVRFVMVRVVKSTSTTSCIQERLNELIRSWAHFENLVVVSYWRSPLHLCNLNVYNRVEKESLLFRKPEKGAGGPLRVKKLQTDFVISFWALQLLCLLWVYVNIFILWSVFLCLHLFLCLTDMYLRLWIYYFAIALFLFL